MKKGLFLSVVFFLLDCSAPEYIRTTTTSKRDFSASAPMQSASLGWETPAGWHEQEAGGMRVASFWVGDSKDGLDAAADGSIVILGGDGGGEAANVNRWRGQIGLSPVGAREIVVAARKEQGALGPFSWWSLTNAATNHGILIAVIHNKDQTVFIKLSGPLKTLAPNKEEFLQLCRSVK